MADLIGIGRAVEKFLGLVESSVGTLYRPRAIRNEGRALAEAEAYRVALLAEAQKHAKLVQSEADRELAERAVARLRHQEMNKQANIESIVDTTIKLIADTDIKENVDKDWLSHFFESCATISNQNVQDLWSKVLARSVTSDAALSRKIIDCLRWLDERLAKQFMNIAPRLYLFRGFFVHDVNFENGEFQSVRFGFESDSMEEIGLLKVNVGKSFSFDFASLTINCQELSDRSVEFRRFCELTHTGRQLASIVCSNITEFRKRRTSIMADATAPDLIVGNYSSMRDEMDSLILPSAGRTDLAVGGIVHFLIEIAARVEIDKSYERKVKSANSTYTVLTRRPLLTVLKTARNRMEIKRGSKRDAQKLHPTEVNFLESLIFHLEKNRGVICNI